MSPIIFVFSLLASTSIILAQSSETSSSQSDLAFEVVSIRQNKSGGRSSTTDYKPGGRFTMVNGAVDTLIRYAFPSQVFEVVGAPNWVFFDRYDVAAVARDNTSAEHLQFMIKNMLVDRLGLVAHYETQERPAYALVVARDDGQLGPEMRRSELDCDGIAAGTVNVTHLRAAAPTNGAPPCGMLAKGGMLVSGGLPLKTLAQSISVSAGRLVVDKTGLAGNFEFTLRYQSSRPGRTDDMLLPSIFTALQEQLGLKLESDRSLVQVVVIDRISRPAPD